ncbi:MAG: ComEC family competence protein [Elusimicrobia bacterium]|nr:ComEC family competence protein [Elusimicrobiota bacterium]
MPLSYLRRPLFLCLLAYIAVLCFLHSRGFFRPSPPEPLALYRRLNGVAVQGRLVSPLKEDSFGWKAFIQADTINSRPYPHKLQAYLPKGQDWTRLRPGMPVRLQGDLRRPRAPLNPGGFDEKTFLEDRGACAVMSVDELQVLGQLPWFWLPKAWAEAARQSMEGFFKKVLPKDEAHVFSGLCLGYKGPLRRDWNRAIQDAGTIHLIVPSGAKTAIVMLCVVFLATLCRIHILIRFLLSLSIGGFYTLMAGAEAPYTRAFWGGTALWVCLLSGRDSGAFQATVLAALLTLLWGPRELFSVGFQMTYAAVLGLVLAMPQIQAATQSLPPRPRGLARVAAISVIVQAMLWPIFANVFGRGSLAGVLANLLLVPASAPLMAAGFGAWLASPALPSGPLLALLARLFVRVCQAFASLPGAASDLSPMSPPAVVSYYFLAGAALVLPRWRASGALAAAGLLVLAGAAAARGLSRPAVSVLYLDLPSSQPALVRFADGRTWLVDPGSRAAAVLKALRQRRVSRLDRVVLTRAWPRPARRRLARGLSWREAVQVSAPWSFCAGAACFEFGGPEGPAVIERGSQNSIIHRRIISGSVEAVSDGRRAEVRPLCPPERPSWSAPWSSSTTRPSPRPDA